MKTNHVAGSHKPGKVTLFALSTCGWCRKTRELLETNGVEYEYVYVDLQKGADKEEVLAELRKRTSRQAFPTIVINEEVIVGFDEAKLKGALKL